MRKTFIMTLLSVIITVLLVAPSYAYCLDAKHHPVDCRAKTLVPAADTYQWPKRRTNFVPRYRPYHLR